MQISLSSFSLLGLKREAEERRQGLPLKTIWRQAFVNKVVITEGVT